MGVVSALAGLSQPPRSTVCLVPEGATQSGVPAAIRELGACSLVHSSVTHPPRPSLVRCSLACPVGHEAVGRPFAIALFPF